MKKTTPTNNARRFNVVPAFNNVENPKVSPKNNSHAYYLRNPKSTQPNIGRFEPVNKTSTSQQASSSSAYIGSNSFVSNTNGLVPASTTVAHNLQLKSPRNLQSPVQRSPSYYPNKGGNSENSQVLKEVTNQIKMNYSPLNLENSTHYNGERRQSTTPKPKDASYLPGYRANFNSGANYLKNSKEFEPGNLSGALNENMKPDPEPVSTNFCRQEPDIARADEKRKITSESLNEEDFKEKYTHSKALLNMQNFMLDSKRHCVRHPDKKSKYYYQDENDIEKIEYYCSKCAVELALNGIKVTEIPGTISSNQRSLEFESRNSSKIAATNSSLGRNSQRSSHETEGFDYQNESRRMDSFRSSIESKRRNEELTNFVTRLEDLLERMKSLENCVNHEKAKAVNNHRTDKETVEWLCKQLIDKINEHKEAVCKSLDNEKSNVVQMFADFSKTPLKYLTEISQIKSDIEENMQNIMRNIEDKPYKRIMQKYEERLTLYDSYLRDKEIAVIKEMIQPKHHSTVEELKVSLRESFEEILGNSMPVPEKKDLLTNIGDFEGFMRCDEEMLELPDSSAHKIHPAAHHKVLSTASTQNYTLVSFENKDIFQNALNTSKDVDLPDESSTCETVIEHEEEHLEGFHSQSNEEAALQGQENYTSEIYSKAQPQVLKKKLTTNRRSRYCESQKKENFEVLVVPSNQNKQINEAFLNFIESKINAESSSEKGNYQKSLFTSPNFKEIYEQEV